MERARIVVGGMHCAHCVAQVAKTLEGLAPDLKAEVDLEAGTALLQGGRLPAPAQLAEALRAAGFSGGERADA